MRKSLARTSLLCGSLVMLSGCYSNGKFHSPTWNDMAWWRKDKAPDTSLAAAPSVGRPSDEAFADKGSPGAKGGSAPPYEAAAASYNTPPADDSRYPNTGYPNTGYPDTSYGAPGAASGGTNWAASGNAAAANVAANPYAKSGGYDTGSRYDAGNGYGAAGGHAAPPADHAQRSPYDSAYPGAGNTYSTHSAAQDYNSRAYSANPEPSGATRGNYDNPTGSYDNPHYRSADPAPPAGGSRYDEGRYTSPDRYAPPAASGASNDKYTAPGYATQQDAARRYDSEGYRGMTGDRYANDAAAPGASQVPTATAIDSRTADSRNATQGDPNTYNPGKTGYQPAGVADYSLPTGDGRATAAAPYQPGGTSRYVGSAGAATGGYDNRYDSPAIGSNPYAAEPRPDNRYQQPPADTRRY